MRIRVKCGALEGWYYLYSDKVEAEILTGFTKVVAVEELYRLSGYKGHSSCYDAILVVNASGGLGLPLSQWLQANLTTQAEASFDEEDFEVDGTPQNTSDNSADEPSQPNHALRYITERIGLQHSQFLSHPMPVDFSTEDSLWVSRLRQGHRQHVDMSQFSQAELLGLAQATWDCNPFRDRLGSEPAIPVDKVADVTRDDQVKRKREFRGLDEVQVMSQLREYLEGTRMEPPWQGLGLSKQPQVQNMDLDLRRLYQIVRELGGFEQVSQERIWVEVAQQLGHYSDYQSAGSQLKVNYQRCLLKYERQTSEMNLFSGYQMQRTGGKKNRPTGVRQPNLILQEEHQLSNVDYLTLLDNDNDEYG